MTPGGLEKMGDAWRLPLDGLTVDRCTIDYAVGLVLLGDSDDRYYLTIEERFRIRVPDHAEALLVPEAGGSELGPVLNLLRRSVTRATASKDGCLEVEFTDGAAIAVASGGQFEAWNLVGPAGLRIVCLPGGGLAVWSPE